MPAASIPSDTLQIYLQAKSQGAPKDGEMTCRLPQKWLAVPIYSERMGASGEGGFAGNSIEPLAPGLPRDILGHRSPTGTDPVAGPYRVTASTHDCRVRVCCLPT